MDRNGFRKGLYEDAVEHAKELLDKGVGMGKVMEVTNLKEKDIIKIQNKKEEELKDK